MSKKFYKLFNEYISFTSKTKIAVRYAYITKMFNILEHVCSKYDLEYDFFGKCITHSDTRYIMNEWIVYNFSKYKHRNRDRGVTYNIFPKFTIWYHDGFVRFYARCIFKKYNTRVRQNIRSVCNDIERYINIIKCHNEHCDYYNDDRYDIVPNIKYDLFFQIMMVYQGFASCKLCNDTAPHKRIIKNNYDHYTYLCDVVYEIYNAVK